MKPNKKEVAIRLKEIRSTLNLTLTEFGNRIGNVPKGTVNSWLRGLALPPRDKLLRIAFLSNTSINWILWGRKSDKDVKQLSEREEEMQNFLDMVNSDLFPMTEQRKELILQIIRLEIEELNSDTDELSESCGKGVNES